MTRQAPQAPIQIGFQARIKQKARLAVTIPAVERKDRETAGTPTTLGGGGGRGPTSALR